MLFMHRGHRSHGGGMGGCCGGGHSHGPNDYQANQNNKQHHHSKPDFAAIPDADFEILPEEPNRKIKNNHDSEILSHSELKRQEQST